MNFRPFAPFEGEQVSNSQFTDEDMTHLTGLPAVEFLFLDGTHQVTGADLAHLTSLSRLRRLDVSGNQVTDAVTANIREALPNTTIDNRTPIPPPPPR